MGESWDGLGWALGAQDRFVIDSGVDFEARLGPKTDQTRSKIKAKMRSCVAIVFGTIFDRFWVDVGLIADRFLVDFLLLAGCILCIYSIAQKILLLYVGSLLS